MSNLPVTKPTVNMIKKQFQKVESDTSNDKKIFVRSGYECLRTNLLRLGKPSINCSVSKKVIIDKLRHHRKLITAKILRLRGKQPLQPYDAASSDVVEINGCEYSKAYLTREHDLNTIGLQKLEYRAAKVKSVLAGFELSVCNGKGYFINCTCHSTNSPNYRCKTCKANAKQYGSSLFFRYLLGSKTGGPVPCVCVMCMKYRGEWSDDDFCECIYVTIHNPLDMCSNCLCRLAIDEFVFKYSWYTVSDSLTMFEKIYHRLLDKECYLVDRRKRYQIKLRHWCKSGSVEEQETKKLEEKIHNEITLIHDTMLALIPTNALDGCNGKRRFNACRCPEIKSDALRTCAYCLCWLANQPVFPSAFHGPINCSCAKCVPMTEEIQCECKSNLRGLENICVRCLCQLALDYDAGKSICFCEKRENQYSCGSNICVNPVRKYMGELKSGITCDAGIKCINNQVIDYSQLHESLKPSTSNTVDVVSCKCVKSGVIDLSQAIKSLGSFPLDQETVKNALADSLATRLEKTLTVSDEPNTELTE
jgi:hypothetical protein